MLSAVWPVAWDQLDEVDASLESSRVWFVMDREGPLS